MGHTIHDIRHNTTRARHLYHRAQLDRFAVGAFNIDTQETLVAVAKAAQKLQAPAIIEVSSREAQVLGLENVRMMVDNYKKEYNVELYLNLDHSPSVDMCKRAIDIGYEFIHIDISQADHQANDSEIIAKTREVVHYASFTGALVESEPHYFHGASNVYNQAINYDEVRKTFSTPAGAKAFVEATGIDTFAAAVGNLHGRYAAPKVLDLALLGQIAQAVDCAISLHGGSGTPLHFFKDAAKLGVRKININSDLRYAYRTTLEKVLREHPQEYAIISLMPEVYAAVQAVIEEKMAAFGSAGKAAP